MGQPVVDDVAVAITLNADGSLRELRSAVDLAMRGITHSSEEAFGDVERAAAEAGHQVGEDVSRGSEAAERSLREFGRAAHVQFEAVQREATVTGTTIATRVGGALKLISGLSITAAATAGLGALVSMGLRSAAALEQTEVAFSSLLGSAERGAQVLDDLKKFAALTPFELGDITGAAQRFLAFNDAVGIADDQLQPFLTTLGNIASVTAAGAEGVDRVTLAIGQIASRGKVGLEDLQQISEALPGFSSVAAIAAATGMTTAETMKAISAGTIDATTGIAALLKGMQQFPGAAGAMEAQSQTLLGVFSTFKDTVSQALSTAFEPVIPAIKQSLTDLTPVLGDALSVLAPVLGDALVGVMDALKPAIEPLAVLLAHTLNAVLPLLPVVGKLVAVLLDGLVPVFVALEPIIQALAPPLMDLLIALMPLIDPLAQLIAAVLQLALPLLDLIGFLAKLASQKAIAPLVSLLAKVFGALATAVGQFAQWLDRIDWGAVGDVIAGFFLGIWNVGSKIVEFFIDLPGNIGSALAQLPGIVGNALAALGQFLYTLPGRIIGVIGRLLKELVSALVNIDWTAVGAAIGAFLAGALAQIGEWLVSIGLFFVRDLPVAIGKGVAAGLAALGKFFTDARDWFASLPKRILDAIGNAGMILFNIGRDIIKGLWNGITSLGGWLAGKVKNFIEENVVQGAKSLLGIDSPSKVMAAEVGAWIPPGIMEGIDSRAPDLTRMIDSIVTPLSIGPSTSISGGSVMLGAGAIVLNIYGSASPEQATALGQAAGQGVMQALQRQDINRSVRAL